VPVHRQCALEPSVQLSAIHFCRTPENAGTGYQQLRRREVLAIKHTTDDDAPRADDSTLDSDPFAETQQTILGSINNRGYGRTGLR
jgi:hypothetical protein